MRWRRWFIEWPAVIVDTWFTIYWFVAFGLTSLAMFMAALVAVLYLFGIRWGW